MAAKAQEQERLAAQKSERARRGRRRTGQLENSENMPPTQQAVDPATGRLTHFKRVQLPATEFQRACAAWRRVYYHQMAGAFLEPVDWRAANLPSYPDVVKEPMDLGTIGARIAAGQLVRPSVRPSVRACVRASVRACVRACARARVCRPTHAVSSSTDP